MGVSEWVCLIVLILFVVAGCILVIDDNVGG